VKDMKKDCDSRSCDDKETTNLENRGLDISKSLRSSPTDIIQSSEKINLQSLPALSKTIKLSLLLLGYLLLTAILSRAKIKQKIYSRCEINYLTV
jgi:hypothetical protein